jgi:polyhydroxyalkanoate synthesis regulator phasin
VGIGMASMTEEKAKEFYNKLLEYGKKYEESDEALRGNLLKSYDLLGEKLESIGNEIAGVMSKNLNMITKKDFEALKEDIEKLKSHIEKIEMDLESIKKQR